MKLSKSTLLVSIVAILIFLIPFLWLRPGEMDLGGDSSRLYFYNPLAYLPNQSLYSVTISGLGYENLSFFGLPFYLFLAFLKTIFITPTFLINIFHGMSLSVGFIFIYLIVKELIKKDTTTTKKNGIIECAAIAAGLLYVFSPTEIYDWAYVIVTHNQIFLNPLIFFLLLKFFTTKNMKYVYFALLITFIFAPNFSFIGAPAIFSFYPVSFLFLYVYVRFVRKISFPYKKTAIALGLFLLLQAFHLIPQLTTSFIPGGHLFTLVNSATGKLDRGLGYFNGIIDSVKITPNLLGLPPLTSLISYAWLFFIIPFVIVPAFLFNKSKAFLITFLVFFICLLFFAGNITHVWVSTYKSLFYIPGFSMFRNFIGQWNYVYLFYFCLLFGQALWIILATIRKKIFIVGLLGFFVTLLIINGIPFIKGSLTRKIDWTSKNISATIVMDPVYEKFLAIIKNLPVDGKVLFFPMNDHGYSAFAGLNGGVYAGPSTISYLAGKKDFTGYDQFEIFRDDFTTMIKNEDYDGIKHLLAVMNIKYLVYNADPHVYGDNFPNFPYGYMRGIMPDTQSGYRQLVKKLGFKEIVNVKNTYYIYEIDDSEYLPHVYIPESISEWNQQYVDSMYPLSFFPKNNKQAFYEQGSNAIQPNDTFTIVSPAQSYPDIFQIQNALKLLYLPFISQKMSSLIYPFIIRKEQHTLMSFPSVSDAYIEKSIYFFEKRILELEKWEKEDGLPVQGNLTSVDAMSKTWKDLTPWRLYTNAEYNYWEVSLARYDKAVKLLVDKINTANASSYSSLIYKTEIHEILKADKAKLTSVIEGSQKTLDKKLYLLQLTDDMYESLSTYLGLQEVVPDNSQYSLSGLKKDVYTPYVYKNSLQNFNPQDITLRLDTIAQPSLQQDNSQWIRFNEITLDPLKNQNVFLSALSMQNLSLGQSHQPENSTQQGDVLQFHVDSTATDGNSGIIYPISGWYPKTQYILSFDYNTHGKNFSVRIFENEGKMNLQTNILDETIQSNTWKTFRRVIGLTTTDPTNFAYSAVLHITKAQDDLLGKSDGNSKNQLFELKNVSVAQVMNPPIVFKKTIKQGYTVQNIPHIIFEKINPTKYVAHISNVTQPYMLVLSDGFNLNWKLIDRDRGATTPSSFFLRTMSFLLQPVIGGLVPHNSLFDKNTFETWGKKEIATERHIVVNNYANGWYIMPSDMSGKKEYTIVIEMTTQINFYLSLLLSLMALVVVIVLLVFRKSKKAV